MGKIQEKDYDFKIDSPAHNAITITPHDSNNLQYDNGKGDGAEDIYIRGFHVGGAGNVVIVTQGDDEVTLNGCLAGMYYPYTAKRIKATGTTATNIVGLF